MIRDHVVMSCVSARLRQRLLREADLTLEKLMTLAHSMEVSEIQAKTMKKDLTKEVNAVYHNQAPYRDKLRYGLLTTKPRYDTSNITCYHCGKQCHIANDSTCPANRAKCSKCSKIGHFGTTCKSTKHDDNHKSRAHPRKPDRPVYYVDLSQSDSDADEAVNVISTSHNCLHKMTINIGSTPIKVILDSGSTANIIDYTVFKMLSKNNVKIEPTTARLYTYGSRYPIKLKGKFTKFIR